MGYTLLSETKPTARKEHRCIWCGQVIPKGDQYTAERSVFDGDMQNHHWHNECLADARTKFVACPVKVSEIVVHANPEYPDKIKAPRVCAPTWEVDINGNKVEVKP